MMNSGADERRLVQVWEWPLRVWHWLFALTVSGSLTTGLSGDIGWMDWHLRFGFIACGLLVFRLLWGFAGGLYSRWATYRATPARVLGYFRGNSFGPDAPPGGDHRDAHTAPGVALIGLMLLAVLVQAVSGLFTTDDIFIEGPLVRHASSGLISNMSWLHHRVFMLVLAAIAMHLTAHLVYGLRRDPLPLAMFTGTKQLPAGLQDTPAHGLRGLLVGLVSAGLVWAALTLV